MRRKPTAIRWWGPGRRGPGRRHRQRPAAVGGVDATAILDTSTRPDAAGLERGPAPTSPSADDRLDAVAILDPTRPRPAPAPRPDRRVAHPVRLTAAAVLAVLATVVPVVATAGSGPAWASDEVATLAQCTAAGAGACTRSTTSTTGAAAASTPIGENGFVGYRAALGGLAEGRWHTVQISYSVVSAGRHAIDYLGSFPTAGQRDPCAQLPKGGRPTAACDPASPTDFLPVPAAVGPDAAPAPGRGPACAAPGSFTGTPAAGRIDLFAPPGSQLDYLDGDPTTFYAAENRPVAGGCVTTVTFRFYLPGSGRLPAGADVVVAWGGHVAWSGNWGVGDTAAGTPASYLMALKVVDGHRTDQARALPGSAVLASPRLGVEAVEAGGTPVTAADPGTAVRLTAGLAGADSPGGRVTYAWWTGTACGPPGRAAGHDTVAVGPTGVPASAPLTLGGAPLAYRAVYGGDRRNTPATAPCSVLAVTPTVRLDVLALPALDGVGQAPLQAAVALGGGHQPTGTVTVRLFGPGQACTATPAAGAVRYTDTLVVAGDALYGTARGGRHPGGLVPDIAGTWQWLATFTPDGGVDAPATSGCQAVPVLPAATGVLAGPTAPGGVVGGTPLDDAALVGGGRHPTGTVTFYLFDPTEPCSATPAFGTYRYTDTVAVGNGGLSALTAEGGTQPGGFVPDRAGTWRWVAVYGGDAANAAAATSCTAQTVAVAPAPTAVLPTAATDPATVGLHPLDTTAAVTGGAHPAGDLTFYLFDPTEPCSAAPTPGTYRYADVVAVDGAGPVGTATGTAPGGFTPDQLGTWQWEAVYSGDADDAPSASACGADPVTVVAAVPTLTVTPTATTEPVNGPALGSVVTVTGGDHPGGSATLYLFDPTETCSADPAAGTYRYADVIPIGGDGTVSTSTGSAPGGLVPDVAGTWTWEASYAGDWLLNAPADSGCQAAVTVTPVPSAGHAAAYWSAAGGHVLLDPTGTGTLHLHGAATSFTVGVEQPGRRWGSVATVARSDEFLGAAACADPAAFDVACTSLPAHLQASDVAGLAAQTLAATYNLTYVQGFGAQTLGELGCAVPSDLRDGTLGLGAHSQMAAVVAAADQTLGGAVAGGTTNTTTAAEIATLLVDCVNGQG